MKTNNEDLAADVNNQFDTLCQGFMGRSFYGLEYVLEEFFQDISVKPLKNTPSIDWFELYQ
jgi:hypothetical protein